MIEPRETFIILDATKISDYMTCPRMYFFSYILGWRPIIPNNHLVFGSSVHTGLEVICRTRLLDPIPILVTKNNPHRIEEEPYHTSPLFQKSGYPEHIDEAAYFLFLQEYRETFKEYTDGQMGQKTPAAAQRMFSKYVQEYNQDSFDTIHTEVAFKVPLSNMAILHGRIDAIIKDNEGYYWVMEHKTGSKLSRQWKDQWSLSVQVNSYIHVLHCMYPESEVRGAIVNGIILTKEPQFIRIRIRKSPRAMQSWMDNLKGWVSNIEADTNRTLDGKMSFKMNTTNCTKYFGCPFHPYCLIWDNPLDHVDEVPGDMEVSHWDPRRHTEKAKEIVDV